MVFLTWVWLFTKFWFRMVTIKLCKYQHINRLPVSPTLQLIIFFDEKKLYQHLSENSSLHITAMILVSFCLWDFTNWGSICLYDYSLRLHTPNVREIKHNIEMERDVQLITDPKVFSFISLNSVNKLLKFLLNFPHMDMATESQIKHIRHHLRSLRST